MRFSKNKAMWHYRRLHRFQSTMVHHKRAVCLPGPHFTNVFKRSVVLRRSFLDLSELPRIVWVVLITHWLFMHVRERAIREKNLQFYFVNGRFGDVNLKRRYGNADRTRPRGSFYWYVCENPRDLSLPLANKKTR